MLAGPGRDQHLATQIQFTRPMVLIGYKVLQVTSIMIQAHRIMRLQLDPVDRTRSFPDRHSAAARREVHNRTVSRGHYYTPTTTNPLHILHIKLYDI